MALAILQLFFGIGYVTLLQLQSNYSHLIILNLLLPVTGLILGLAPHLQKILVLISALVLTLQTAMCLILKMKKFYYSTRYIYCAELCCRHRFTYQTDFSKGIYCITL